MKRFMLIVMALLVGLSAYAQDLGAFATGFQTFATEAAPTMSYNATVGNNWSDAYLGQLPHFGVGLSFGATMVPSASMEPLFAAMAIDMPAELKKYGLPIPAAALSAKIGGFILPFDVGLKGMMLPEAVTEKLSAQGIAADYKLIGGNVRLGLVKEGVVYPDVSIGLGYNRLTGSMSMDLDVAPDPFTYQTYTVTVADPTMAIEWTTDSFDVTAQVSKKLLFIRPYLAAGYSFGKSTFAGGLKGNVIYTGGTEAQVKQALTDAGYDVSSLDATGFMFGAESDKPVFRLFGGFSLDLLFIVLDLQGTWVPQTKSLGANAMLRIQF